MMRDGEMAQWASCRRNSLKDAERRSSQTSFGRWPRRFRPLKDAERRSSPARGLWFLPGKFPSAERCGEALIQLNPLMYLKMSFRPLKDAERRSSIGVMAMIVTVFPSAERCGEALIKTPRAAGRLRSFHPLKDAERRSSTRDGVDDMTTCFRPLKDAERRSSTKFDSRFGNVVSVR